ncbi:hypothetical protein PMAYCL1PPCAC_07824, partial [Pristionchus mayeri]
RVMLLLVRLFLLVGGALAMRFEYPYPSEKRYGNAVGRKETLDETIPDGLDLVYISNIWRHGDRAPTSAMVGEKAPEEYWTFGGGGWGELSPIGMRQHFNLGKKLYDRYAANNKFLSETYKAKEIYVHCTDKNRTITSAMSHLAGMYSRPKAKVGRDYPDISEWPKVFIPIPVHTEWAGNDHIGDPATYCPRQDDLWKLVQKTQDYKDANGDYTQQTLQYLRAAIGVDDASITFENVYKIWDNMLIEGIWFPDNVTDWYPYYTDDVNEQVTTINDWGIDLVNGIMNDSVIDGYDLPLEINRIRAGPLINDIMAKARGVLQCRLRDSYGQQNDCKDGDHFYRNLKYHAVSSHDTTISAYLTVLGAKTKVLTRGYPWYSAAVVTEFYIDRRNGGTDQVFRVIYHDNEDSDFRVITPLVDGCDGKDFCPVEVLQNVADKYAPPGGINVLCNQRINA